MFAKGSRHKKNQNVNFFQIGLDPPPPPTKCKLFSKSFLTIYFLNWKHFFFSPLNSLSLHNILMPILKHVIFNNSKYQKCKLWVDPPPPFGKSLQFELFFLDGFPYNWRSSLTQLHQELFSCSLIPAFLAKTNVVN